MSTQPRDAVLYLEEIGVLIREEGPGYRRLSAYGWEYWEKLTEPRRYWYRKNWFAALVAGATVLTAVVSAVANIVNLVL